MYRSELGIGEDSFHIVEAYSDDPENSTNIGSWEDPWNLRQKVSISLHFVD